MTNIVRVAAVGALVLLTACGSTVPQQVARSANQAGPALSQAGPAPDGLGGAPGAASGPGAQAAPNANAPATTAAGSQTSRSSVGAGADARSGEVSVRRGAANGAKVPSTTKGADNNYIYFGTIYSSDSARANSAIGASGAQPSYDSRAMLDALISYANKHGGFAGRQLKALYFDAKAANDANASSQAACDFFTKDNKVFLMPGSNEILRQCAERAGAVHSGTGTSKVFQRYPHMVNADAIAFDRLGTITVNGLDKAKYFSGKLGLVTFDDTDYRFAITNGYLPALRRIGITPDQIAYVTAPQSASGVADLSASVSSAITKFKARGIDHVIIQDGPIGICAGICATFVWMNQARNQQYYPRYGMNTFNAMGNAQLPPDQQDKAVSIDQFDYKPSQDSGWRLNPVRQRCFDIYNSLGMPIRSNENDQAAAAANCDTVFFYQRVLNLMPEISADAFVRVLPQLGTSLGSAFTFGTHFVVGRRDGGSHVRTADYALSCSCVTYRGAPYDAS